jgi:hypothetical protein
MRSSISPAHQGHLQALQPTKFVLVGLLGDFKIVVCLGGR